MIERGKIKFRRNQNTENGTVAFIATSLTTSQDSKEIQKFNKETIESWNLSSRIMRLASTLQQDGQAENDLEKMFWYKMIEMAKINVIKVSRFFLHFSMIILNCRQCYCFSLMGIVMTLFKGMLYRGELTFIPYGVTYKKSLKFAI